jgi:hypothetical protein
LADPALMRIRLNIVRRHSRAFDQPSAYDPKQTFAMLAKIAGLHLVYD